jgi:hypothetical protein
MEEMMRGDAIESVQVDEPTLENAVATLAR